MTDHSQLPDTITRPLRKTTYAIAAFLLGFGLWAVYAPLSSTLYLSGKLTSSRPTFELQNPYGGLIDEVLVTRHERVKQGQTVMRMDMVLEHEQLTTLKQTQAIYQTENTVIQSLLSDLHGDERTGSPSATDASPYTRRHKQALVQSALQTQNAAFLRQQSNALRTKITYTEQQLDLMRGREDRQASLQGQGLLKRSEGEVLKEQILMVQSEIEEDRASLASLEGQIEAAQAQAELIMLSLSEYLIAKRDENTKRLHDINRQMNELQDQLKKSVVRSPVDGVVSDIHFEATGMYAARGETLISLTQPLAKPMVSFEVPVGQIDQMHPGMRGSLILTSLPQRAMPRVEITVQAISPRATLDETGTPVSYTGLAAIEHGALKTFQSDSTINLTEDMPAQLLIEAQKTSLARYILDPVSDVFRNAVQD